MSELVINIIIPFAICFLFSYIVTKGILLGMHKNREKKEIENDFLKAYLENKISKKTYQTVIEILKGEK